MDDLNPQDIEALSKAIGHGKEGRHSKGSASLSPVKEKKGHGQEESSSTASTPSISRVQFMQLNEIAAAAELPPSEMERMFGLKVNVEVILGRTKMPLEEILKLHSGSVLELDKLAGEPVDILVNGILIARAEVVVIEDNFGVKVIEIVGVKQKLSAIQG